MTLSSPWNELSSIQIVCWMSAVSYHFPVGGECGGHVRVGGSWSEDFKFKQRRRQIAVSDQHGTVLSGDTTVRIAETSFKITAACVHRVLQRQFRRLWNKKLNVRMQFTFQPCPCTSALSCAVEVSPTLITATAGEARSEDPTTVALLSSFIHSLTIRNDNQPNRRYLKTTSPW
jgi:hypothetical protein